MKIYTRLIMIFILSTLFLLSFAFSQQGMFVEHETIIFDFGKEIDSVKLLRLFEEKLDLITVSDFTYDDGIFKIKKIPENN